MIKKPRVFVTGSLWSLLIYLVYNDLDDIKRTHYFFGYNSIHKTVRKNFHHHAIKTEWEDSLHWRLVQFFYIFIPIINIIRWPYLLFADVWGIDQGWAIQAIIGRKQYTLIEDGIGDYYINRSVPSYKNSFIRTILWGKIYKHDFGRNSKCKKYIFTQQLIKNDEDLVGKAEVINLMQLWNNSSKEKREFIMLSFNITEDDLMMLSSRKVLLLTQPLSEDRIMTEKEKIDLYREIIKNIDYKDIIVKPHPRERTDYHNYFSGVLVMDKVVPFQLFDLLNVKFHTIITICSTSAYNLKCQHTKIIFTGSTIDKRIASAYGVIPPSKLNNN